MGKPFRILCGKPCRMTGLHTRGSKTFQYPEEKKSIDIASVAASERATAQSPDSNIGAVVRRKFRILYEESYKIAC